MISVVSWAAGPTSAPVIPKTFHNPGTSYSSGSSTSGSVYFDGVGDHLQVNSMPSLLSNNWTMECFVYTTNAGAGQNQHIYDGRGGGPGSGDYVLLQIDTNENVRFFTDGAFRITSSVTLSANTWYHIALERNGTAVTLYVDGQSQGSYDPGAQTWLAPQNGIARIGADDNGTGYFVYGYISNFRVVIGAGAVGAVYGGNFTPPVQELTAITGTILLTCQNTSGTVITDASTNNLTITTVGDAVASNFDPFSNSGSTYFDGSGDSLDVGTFTIGTDAFTIESWYQPKFNTSGSDTVFLYDVSSEDIRTTFKNGNIRAQLGSETELSYSIGSLDQNKWYHTALQRDSSGNVNLYHNGIDVANYSSSGQNVSGNTLRIGDKQAGSKEYTGYISNFRIVKGNALYTPASIGGSAYFDGAGDYTLTATNANLVIGSNNFTAECWIHPTTFSTVSNVIDRRRSGDGSAYDWTTYLTTNGEYAFYANGGTRITSSALTANKWYHTAVVRNINTGNTTLYVDGISQGTYSDSNVYPSNQLTFGMYGPALPGSESLPYTGYLSNFRLIIGTAANNGVEYSTSFTPPASQLTKTFHTEFLTFKNTTGSINDESNNGISITANGDVSASTSSPYIESKTALTDITNTKLLTCNKGDGTIVDASSNNHTVTTNGDAVASHLNPFGS